MSRCNNLSCDPANLTLAGSGQIRDDGTFELTLTFREVAGTRLLFAAVVSETAAARASRANQTAYQVMDFGPVALGGSITDVQVDPSSAAALLLLTDGGLQNYSDDAIRGTVAAVRTANAATSFAGEDAAAAVATAMETAHQDPSVQQALAAARPFCLGDCNDDRAVTVNEIVTLVNIALGNTDLVACIPGNRSADVVITVDELLGAVNAALSGCPM